MYYFSKTYRDYIFKDVKKYFLVLTLRCREFNAKFHIGNADYSSDTAIGLWDLYPASIEEVIRFILDKAKQGFSIDNSVFEELFKQYLAECKNNA